MDKFISASEQLALGNIEEMKTWTNTELGETWEEPGECIDGNKLINRRELYDAEVPDGVLVLTAAVDVQKDRFEAEVVGWGVGKESWGIRYQKIYGDTKEEKVWADLDAFLQVSFHKKDGTALQIAACCIDAYSPLKGRAGRESPTSKTRPRTTGSKRRCSPSALTRGRTSCISGYSTLSGTRP